MRIADMLSALVPCPICQTAPKWEYAAKTPSPPIIEGPCLSEIFNSYDRTIGHAVVCTSCDFSGPYGKTEEEAVENWNSNTGYILERYAPLVLMEVESERKAVAA